MAGSDYHFPYHDYYVSDDGKNLHGTDFRCPKRKELLDAAKHFDLEVNESVSKAELKKLVLNYLVEELMAEPEFTDELRGEQLLELKRLEFKNENLKERIKLS